MSHPRVLCLGESLFDLISNEPGLSYEKVQSWTAYPGGAPANVACALAKLGSASGFIGCIGNDDPGDQLVQLFQDVGVHIGGIQRHPIAPTREIYVVLNEKGDRQFVGFGNRNTAEFADAFLQAKTIPEDLFQHADYLVLGTLEMAYESTGNAISHSLHCAHQYHVKIVLDVNWRPVFWDDPDAAKAEISGMLHQVDFLKCSDEEALWLFETTNPEAIAQRLENVEGVLVTAGEDGCAYWLAGNKGEVPAFRVDVEETTGAGDSFLAGFLHQLCQQGCASLQQSARAHDMMIYASAVGALTATRPGAIAAQPTSAEVEAFLHLQAQYS